MTKCACVCVCVLEREGAKTVGREKESGRANVCVDVCLCEAF